MRLLCSHSYACRAILLLMCTKWSLRTASSGTWMQRPDRWASKQEGIVYYVSQFETWVFILLVKVLSSGDGFRSSLQPSWSPWSFLFPLVEGFYGTRYQSGSFSLINVGSDFHCLRSIFLIQSRSYEKQYNEQCPSEASKFSKRWCPLCHNPISGSDICVTEQLLDVVTVSSAESYTLQWENLI